MIREISRSKCSERQKHDNPARSTLKRRGIEFPSSKFISSSSTSSNANGKNKGSQLLYTAPCSQQEEAEKLAIVMRESLHKTEPQTLVSANTNLPYSNYLPIAYGWMNTGAKCLLCQRQLFTPSLQAPIHKWERHMPKCLRKLCLNKFAQLQQRVPVTLRHLLYQEKMHLKMTLLRYC